MAPPSPPLLPVMNPLSDTEAPLLLATEAAAASVQNLSLVDGTQPAASPDLATPVDGGDDGGGSCSKTAPAPAPKKKSKYKRDENGIWTPRPSRKPKKKAAPPQPAPVAAQPPPVATGAEECAPGKPVLLSRVFKSERIMVFADRRTAASSKGYRMVRATHGVAAGAWYFEVKVRHLGDTGHTRLGWATNMADIDMPVGFGEYSFGYRDIDGAKVHMSWREKYGGEGYGEGDVLGFYISLPDGEKYEPQVSTNNKGKPVLLQAPEKVPGSKICYFKNGVCQGLAFMDISGGRYYPAASLYTMPKEENCMVKFNFGPNFKFFPQDFGGLPIPQPMSEVPRQAEVR